MIIQIIIIDKDFKKELAILEKYFDNEALTDKNSIVIRWLYEFLLRVFNGIDPKRKKAFIELLNQTSRSKEEQKKLVENYNEKYGFFMDFDEFWNLIKK